MDTEGAFLGADVDGLRISAHDYHGSGEANAIFARAVLGALESRGLLDDARTRAPR